VSLLIKSVWPNKKMIHFELGEKTFENVLLGMPSISSGIRN